MLNIKVKTKDILRAIRIVENAIEDDKTDSRNTGIYIETDENKLIFKGIGQNIFIKCECDANIIEEGNIIIKYKLIEEYLKKIDQETIEIVEKNSQIEIRNSESNARYTLIEYKKPIDAYISNGVEYIFDKKLLLENIENTQFAASTDITKTTINCIKFDVSKTTLKLVATDSYRLMYREVEMTENKTNENISVNLPLKTIQSLVKVLRESSSDELVLKSDGTKVLFKLNDVEILTKVVELQFPDYKTILETVKADKKIEIAKADFQKKLDLVQLFVRDKKERKDVAEFLFSADKLTINGNNDTAVVSENVLINKECEDIKIYLNVRFLLEYLNTVKNSKILEINLYDAVSAVILKEEDRSSNSIYLTMPLKL